MFPLRVLSSDDEVFLNAAFRGAQVAAFNKRGANSVGTADELLNSKMPPGAEAIVMHIIRTKTFSEARVFKLEEPGGWYIVAKLEANDNLVLAYPLDPEPFLQDDEELSAAAQHTLSQMRVSQLPRLTNWAFPWMGLVTSVIGVIMYFKLWLEIPPIASMSEILFIKGLNIVMLGVGALFLIGPIVELVSKRRKLKKILAPPPPADESFGGMTIGC